MKKILRVILLFIIVLAGCSPGGPGLSCTEGVCIDIKSEEPVESLKTANFVVSVRSEKDIAGLGLSIETYPGATIKKAQDSPEHAELGPSNDRNVTWEFDAKGTKTYTFTVSIIVDKPSVSYGVSKYNVIAAAYIPQGGIARKSYSIYLDGEGKHVDDRKAKILRKTPWPLPTDATPYITRTPEASGTIATDKTPINSFENLMRSYEKELKSDKTSKEAKELIKIKYEALILEATALAEAFKQAKTKEYETPTILETPEPIIYYKAPDGIDGHPIIPDRNVFPKDVIPANGWHKEIEDQGTLFVYAGYVTGDRSQGVVCMKDAGKTLKFKKFLAPANSGKLKIVSEVDMLLTLESETGQTFYFDIKLESFVDQDGNIIS